MQRSKTDARVIIIWVSGSVFTVMATLLFGWKGAILAISGHLTLIAAIDLLDSSLIRQLQAIREAMADLQYQTRNLR